MINQFVMVAGCSPDHAKDLLQLNNWQFQTALSYFFQDGAVTSSANAINCSSQYHPIGRFNPICTPANTPATPPNFPEALLALSKLSTSDGNSNNSSKSCSQRNGGHYDSVNHPYHFHPRFASPSRK